MPTAATRKVSFNGGIVSPYLDGRIDLQRYQTGSLESTNQIPCDWGGSVTRPGLVYDERLNRLTVMHSYVVSSTTRYLLLFSDQELRIVKDGSIIQSGGSDLVISTPYNEADLYELKIDSLVDLLWIAHPLYPPYQLKRISDTSWTFGEMSFIEPPMIPREGEAAKLNPSAKTGNITVTSTQNIFEPEHVGSYWKIGHTTAQWSTSVSLEGTANILSDTIPVNGEWSFITSGNWRGDIQIQRSYDGSTGWHVIREFSAQSDLRNEATTGNESITAFLRIYFISANYSEAQVEAKVEAAASAAADYSEAIAEYNTIYSQFKLDPPEATQAEVDAAKQNMNDKSVARALADQESLEYRSAPQYNPYASLEIATNEVYGLVKITDYTDAQTVSATVQRDLFGSGATGLWQEGSWSEHRGYPAALSIHERRLIFAATRSHPNRLWASKLDDRENFLIGEEDDEAIAFDMTTRDVVNWMISADRLFVGTRQEELLVSSGRDDLPITPENVSAKARGSIGSNRVQAIKSSNSVLYAERRGRRIRQIVEDQAYGSFTNDDVTVFAPHLFNSSILQMAAAQMDQKLVYVLLSNRKLLCMNHNLNQRIMSWFVIETKGDFESVAALTGDQGEDEVYVITRRTIDGQEVRQLEHFAFNQWDLVEAVDTENMIYADMAQSSYEAVERSEITGLDDWEGEEVQILADGSIQPNKTITGGTLTLDRPAKRVVFGLPFESRMTPLWFEDIGSPTQGNKRKVTKIRTSMYKGGNVKIVATDEDAFGALNEDEKLLEVTVPRRLFSDSLGEAPSLENGFFDVSLESRHSRKQSITFIRNSPLPMIIQSLHLLFNVGHK